MSWLTYWQSPRSYLALSLLILSTFRSTAADSRTNSAAIGFSSARLDARGIRPEKLSSGALLMLDRGGDLVRPSDVTALAAGAPAILDFRVGPNIRLGDDPTNLPAARRAQAEPHIIRHPLNPDFLAAIFQEGRFTDGGAVDCGYSISTNGGLNWTRALIPGVTPVTGGPYYRASDPVAGIDLNGNVYLNIIALIDTNETMSAILLSRSTNGGASFGPPTEIARSPDASLFLDKNWMTISTFPGAPNSGRIVATWTRFGSAGIPIMCAHSDDSGRTWTTPILVTPSGSACQGSQPVFLPNGNLVIMYWNDGNGQYEAAVSTNGGTSFVGRHAIAALTPYDPPNVRSGSDLCAAVGDRTNGFLYVTSQATIQGEPRVVFMKSTNGGVNWSTPKIVSDNPAGVPVFNPAIGVSPDGKTVTITFYDARVNPSAIYLYDIYLAQSFDGGATWQPNIRVSSVSTDLRLAPLTASGYMVGDYMAVAAPVNADTPAVPIWVDSRTGNPDPFIGRIGISSNITYQAWRAARFSLAEAQSPQIGAPTADADGDGWLNVSEYAFGLNPRSADAPKFTSRLSSVGGGPVLVANYQRLHGASDLAFSWSVSTNLAVWALAPAIETTAPDSNPNLDDVSVQLGAPAAPSDFFRLDVNLTLP